MGTDILHKSINEKDIEGFYRHNLMKKFKDLEITSPFGCDGFGVSKQHKIRVLMEFKDKLNLRDKLDLSKVIAQSIFYVKKFYDKGIIPPSTIFIGDRNECAVIHVNDIVKYLEMGFDWGLAPSSAGKIGELVGLLIEDVRVNPFIFDSKDFDQCFNKICDLTENIQRTVLVTNKNITEVFNYFEKNVLGSVKMGVNDKANLFVQLLVNREENYLHPISKRAKIVTKAFGEVNITSRDKFESFFAHFSSSYTPSQKEKLAAVVDRIVEDTTRRKQGEFFTPSIWVDKAHEYIASVYGEDWKERYVVWDPAWGTGNLTRDYRFGELYCSTLNQSDIDTANQMGFNPEGVKFQFDFLNDDYGKLPEGLRVAIEGGRDIIVLMNPPYATANVMGSNSKHKEGVAKTVMNEMMVNGGWGKSAQNLYAQFLFRVNELQKTCGNIHIGVFCPPLFLTGDSYLDFRKRFFDSFGFVKGFLFEAANFSDVAKDWGISFSVIGDICNDSKVSFNFDLIECNDNVELVKINDKTLYNIDGQQQASKWVRLGVKGLKTFDAPQLSSSMIVKPNGIGNIVKDALGYFYNNSNSISKNNQSVGLFSSCMSAGHGLSIIPQNFNKCCNLFTSRRLISGNLAKWDNWGDEYLTPNEQHLEYEQFSYDSIIYSLFESKSNQSSLRQVEYKDKLWDIKNEFFWLSVEHMKKLGDDNGFDELYNDARTDVNRFVYKKLYGEEKVYDKLSVDARMVLDKANELVNKSINMRRLMVNEQNHLHCWDAGYSQLKLVWKEYFSDDFKEFRTLYKNLEDRMRPLVYELGFLLK